METKQDWVSYQCSCGFRMERIPRAVVADLPRCLGCGRSLRAPSATLRTSALSNVRDLR